MGGNYLLSFSKISFFETLISFHAMPSCYLLFSSSDEGEGEGGGEGAHQLGVLVNCFSPWSPKLSLRTLRGDTIPSPTGVSCKPQSYQTHCLSLIRIPRSLIHSSSSVRRMVSEGGKKKVFNEKSLHFCKGSS